MRILEGGNRLRTGLLGVIIVVLVIGVGQSFASIPMLFAQPVYYSQFSNSAGLHTGDEVRIFGMKVGAVRSIDLDPEYVTIGFTLGTTTIGKDSRLTIRTDTILGKKTLEIEPRGADPIRPNTLLPIGNSTTPYQIYDAFSDVTKTASGWDFDTVKRSLDVLSETLDQTAPHLSAALDGVARFSDTIGKRDQELRTLLAEANKVSGVLRDRSGQINQLLLNAQSLLAAINRRGQAIDALLQRVSALSIQVQGFIADTPNLKPTLEQLRTVTDLLVKHKDDLADVLTTLSKFTASLAEAVGSGPYFKVLIANLLPYQFLQPFVDAAFKKRGIDPEEFWRNAGLPSFRFPDPNGQRFPNGAPPPAPTPLEGTPEHPGPAVIAGSPCSYTPPADGVPSPTDPLPCAALDQGPFGPVPRGFEPPDVPHSMPVPNAPAAASGVPAAAIPGQPPPTVPGLPVPIAPGSPGARTVPLTPPDAPGMEG
ncbi:virulence factor Mce family protein [Mycolicibacterium rhodesiae NBB3]|uniref:Virulence factor Mce family protein n=1 Tax=Mycolicibacterium rhodesiae (strain NBB3) TaxID=710685 RepID=G8RQ01_MYCRN|nr:MCE family protein [Mycolicibacterium rhodesiae]AEV73885.1 virulence factor Mce family protein [Mycolicibacterium rhodesiae NBB3]